MKRTPAGGRAVNPPPPGSLAQVRSTFPYRLRNLLGVDGPSGPSHARHRRRGTRRRTRQPAPRSRTQPVLWICFARAPRGPIPQRGPGDAPPNLPSNVGARVHPREQHPLGGSLARIGPGGTRLSELLSAPSIARRGRPRGRPSRLPRGQTLLVVSDTRLRTAKRRGRGGVQRDREIA